ncbi:MAG: sigma factor-like helix-turn-helix DNA-binding protein [Planctomycetota bacterium]
MTATRPLSQAEVAALLGVTRTRVHQIEKRALEKLRREIARDERLRQELLLEIDHQEDEGC